MVYWHIWSCCPLPIKAESATSSCLQLVLCSHAYSSVVRLGLGLQIKNNVPMLIHGVTLLLCFGMIDRQTWRYDCFICTV